MAGSAIYLHIGSLLLLLIIIPPPSVGPGAAGLNEQARAIRDGTFDDAAAATAEAALS